MTGAIAGDIIGSPYERKVGFKTTDFPLFSLESRFTDDTVLTIAVADALLHGLDYTDALKHWFRRYPNAGYGGTFFQWAASEEREPYGSWGNGSAMRVSPVGYAFATLEETLHEARRTAGVTHNHPEGIRGAQAIAAAVYLARTGQMKAQIRTFIETTFGYDLSEPLDSIRDWYVFDVSCQGSVPQAIVVFLESENFEDAVRKAVSLGGDSDTLACMAGGIAQAFYGGIPEAIRLPVLTRLSPPLLAVLEAFETRYLSPA